MYLAPPDQARWKQAVEDTSYITISFGIAAGQCALGESWGKPAEHGAKTQPPQAFQPGSSRYGLGDFTSPMSLGKFFE